MITKAEALRFRAQAIRICAEIGASFELDEDSQCYRATAPKGQRFEPGLHEIIAVFEGGFIGNGQSKGEALQDLAERLDEYKQAGGLERCGPQCYCREE